MVFKIAVGENVKWDWKTFLVVGAVAIFILNYIVMTMNASRHSIENEENYTSVILQGSFLANASVAEYSPYLVTAPLNEGNLSLIKNLSFISEIRRMKEGYALEIDESFGLKKAYLELKKRGIDSIAIASLYILPPVFYNENGVVKSLDIKNNPSVKRPLPPVVPLGDKVSVYFSGRIKDQYIVSFDSFDVLPSSIEKRIKGRVLNKTREVYKYIIPWEDRNEIDKEEMQDRFGHEFKYIPKNFVLITGPINQDALREDYVGVLSKDSFSVSENMTDKERILSDFGENVSFPPSVLEVPEQLELSYPYSKEGEYLIEFLPLDDEEFVANRTIELSYNKSLELGREYNFTISGFGFGNTLLAIKDVKVIEEELEELPATEEDKEEPASAGS